MINNFIQRTYTLEGLYEQYNFESIVQNNSLSVILGEPASGKTEQLKEYKEQNPDKSEFIELIDIENEDDISEEIEVVLLDSIDEALSRNDSDKILKNKLSKYIKKCKEINPNIKVVITCRGAEWHEIFKEELEKIDKEFKIFYIEDLTIDEINILLEQSTINQEEFWKFIKENYLEQLLKNIMMVLYLIANFENYKGKILKYFEIYEEIIKEHILPKTDNERSKLFEKTSLKEILLISSSLATYMTLNRKRVISVEDINKLANCLYKIDSIEITGEKLKLACDTALLRGSTKNMRFFHKSIQEYLCAYFINERKFDIKTIKEIFAYKDGFYEEFEEVIIYLTNIKERFFKYIVSFDPMIFRRHPYLTKSQQIILVSSMLQTLKIDGHKAWTRRDYIEDSSLVRLDLKEKLVDIIKENVNPIQVNRELFSYLQSLLSYNYSKELEDVLFEILENIKKDKKLCLDYMRINYIKNLNYNQRLFDFIGANNLILKKEDYLYCEVFETLYGYRDFKELVVLLESFSHYHNKKTIEKVEVKDIVFWLKKIIYEYNKREQNFSNKRISFLIFLVFKNFRDIEDKKVLKTILEFMQESYIYKLEFYIGEYEKEQYKFDFKDIKDEFWEFYFSQNKDVYKCNILKILKYCDLAIKDIEEVSKNYPIEKYKDFYICFRMIIRNIDDFLMQNEEYKIYMENIRKNNEENDKKWKERDKPWKEKYEKEEHERQKAYLESISSLETREDAYRVYNIAKYYSKNENVKEVLIKDLGDKYQTFIKLLKKEFSKDDLYIEIKKSHSSYNISSTYNFLFLNISIKDIEELIKDEEEYEKLFWHVITRYKVYENFFIEISRKYTQKLVQFSLEVLKTRFFDGNLIYLLKELNIFDKKNLDSLITEIRQIPIHKLGDENQFYQKNNYLDVLSTDKENYDFIKALYFKNRTYATYFKYLMKIDINRAIEDYIDVFALQGSSYLTFSLNGSIDMLKPCCKLHKLDVYEVSPIIRSKFKTLVMFFRSLNENEKSNYLENLNAKNIKYILKRHSELFKHSNHIGSYSPDSYDEMERTINNIWGMLSEDTSNIPLLEKLKDIVHERAQQTAKYQLQKAYNLTLKNREYSEEYYKTNIDSFKVTNDIFFDYIKLEKDLVDISLSRMDSRQVIYNEEEDLINDRFRDALNDRGYVVCDQSRGGESQSGKSIGERDLIIKNKDGNIVESIIEAFILKSFDKTVIDKHCKKLVEKYDTIGNEQNFILVYSKTKSFQDLWDKYTNNFEKFEEKKDTKNNLKVGHTYHGEIKVCHIFINFYSEAQR